MPSIQRVLVTGGAGFLGSHLCERLVEEGHDVICLDNFFTSQKSNVVHLLGRPNFELIRHDVTLPIFLEVDQVYHLACPAARGTISSIPSKRSRRLSWVRSTCWAWLNAVGRRFSWQARAKSMGILMSIHSLNPIGETSIRSGVRSCYDEGKRVAETLFMDYHRMNRVNIRIVRIFNTYGPRMHPYDGRVVSNFIRQAITGQDITLFGEGDQTRSFCYRDDLVEGFVRMMNADDSFVGPVNIGKPGEFTIRELAELVLQMTGSKSKIIKKPLPPDDPSRRPRYSFSSRETRMGADDSPERRFAQDHRLVQDYRSGSLSTTLRITF